MYSQIKTVSPNSRIYILGYPQLFSTTSNNCGVNVRLNLSERKFSQGIIRYLNDTIKAAADYSGVAYVEADNVFSNRQLCDGPQDSLAVNGLTAGHDILWVIGNESFHPNPIGHILMAERVMARTDGLSAQMPNSNSSASAPDPLSAEYADFLAVPHQGWPIRSLYYEDQLAGEIIVPGTSQDATFPAPSSGQYELWLNSTPTYLGTFTSDLEGNLNLSFSVPQDTPAGFHTLHLYGKNAANEDLDIYKTIFVAASDNDYDGDGVANSNDSCDAFENSGEDADQDSTDDACDSFMDKLPTPSNDSENPKPPENNPETEAGDHQALTVPIVQTASLVTHQHLNNISLDAPRLLPVTTNSRANIRDTAQPQVAAATNISNQAALNKPAQIHTKNNLTHVKKYIIPAIIMSLFLLLLVPLVLHKTHKQN